MTTEPTAPTAAALDHDLLLAEIYAEVERRRSSGELRPDVERELDRAFADLAPPGALGDDTALVLERVQRSSFIEPRVPLEGLRPPVSLIKRVLFKLMAWYVHFVTEQVSAFGGAVTSALRTLDGRVESLERGGAAVPPRLQRELERLDDRTLPSALVDAVGDRLAGLDGRVLVADAGSGDLVRALRARALDVYGAEARRSRLPAALREGLEIRAAGALEHLAALADSRLAAVVLVGGAVELGPPSSCAELASQAARTVRTGGRVLVLSQTLEAWVTGAGGPAADLAPGRPLRPSTWEHLLAEVGLVVEEVVLAPAEDPVAPIDPDVPGATQLNEVLARLGPVLSPAPAYLVIARRAS